MLHQVLWKNRSPWQLLGASIGIFIGLFLLLFALQVYLDVQTLTKGARDNNFLVLNKSFEKNYNNQLAFSEEDLEEMREQPFFNRVDAFESNTFKVSLTSQRLGFRTLLFFQSLPVSYLDVDTTLFKWKKGEPLPIVLSSDYLTLYNFGFAPSQGLPKFSAKTISLVDFTVTIAGKGGSERFEAYVAGFTPNVNSILVPPNFMEYANSMYGDEKEAKDPTQLIAATDNPYNVNLEQFLEEKGYELSKGGLIGGELKSSLFILVFLLVAIGLTIVSLALLVFVLNFQVLIAQSSHDIRLLLQLGYLTKDIAATLSNQLLKRFGVVVVAVFALLLPVKYAVTASLAEQGYQLSFFPHWIVWLVGILLCALFVGINYSSIQKNVQGLA
ncbi:MAG: hypothetical protein ACRBFS_20825 [Aureispira sp.]